MAKSETRIIMYTSNFCGHSWAVERFMSEHEIPVKLVNIDRDPKAREKVMALNNGNASVPTLIFPDGRQLTEPSFRELRATLNIEKVGIVDKIRSVFSRESE